VVAVSLIKLPPDVSTFPRRNRIVSGWSMGLLVIEAGFRSGALITAGQALDQGRALFVVPGPIDKPTSMGSNRLIQQGAKLVMEAKDVLDEFSLLVPELPQLEATPARTIAFQGNEQAVYEAIGDAETPMDTIIAKSGLPAAAVSSTLLALEMKRCVKRLPGQHFIKLL